MMLLYLGGFKPSMLPVSPEKMYLGGYNQIFMNSSIFSYDDKILSKKSCNSRELKTQIGKVTESYSNTKLRL